MSIEPAPQTVRLAADEATVREHVRIIHERAAQACAGIKDVGYLRLVRINPWDTKPRPVSELYAIGDVEPMVQRAIADAAAGHNCHIEGRTIRPSTGGKRGDARATGWVFALVIDNDSDTDRVDKLAIQASLTIETLPNNTHEWLFLEHAIPYQEAKSIGEAMRVHVGGDHCSGNPVQPYRVAGTPNFPNKAKQDRGRVPTPTRIKERSGKVYTADDLRAAFPAKVKSDETRKKSARSIANVDWSIAEAQLPQDLRRLIQDGVAEGDRSEQFHHCIGWLKDLKWTASAITALMEKYPDGIASKYTARIAQEVERSFDKVADPAPDDGGDDDDGKFDGGKDAANDPDLVEMNSKYAVVKLSGKTRVVELEDSPITGCKVPVYSSIPDFRAFHDRRKKQLSPKKSIGVGSSWIKQSERRQYDGVVYAPGTTTPGKMNLWTGFGCEPKKGGCGLYIAHLRDNICSGNAGLAEYFLDWMARGVQQPDRAGEVAAVLKGKEGVGKGVLAKYYGRCFGSHFRHIAQASHLTGKFNSHLQHCSCLFADEAFFAGDRSHESILKAIITEETLMIEPKGLDAYPVRNCIRLIMSSNSDWVVPAGADARRYFVLNVSDAKKQDSAYFAAIAAQMENGGQEALLDLLLNRNISKFNVRDVPQTDALAEQKQHSRRDIDRLVEVIAYEGILPGSTTHPDVAVTTGEERGVGFYHDAKTLVPELKRLGSIVTATTLNKQWGCETWRSANQRGLKFPPLKGLRDRFDKKHGKQDWPELDDWASDTF